MRARIHDLSVISLDLRYAQDKWRPGLAAWLDHRRAPLGLEDADDVVEAWLDRVWPAGAPGAMLAANITSNGHPWFRLRPPVQGPRSASFAAGPVAPALRAYRRQGRLVVNGWEWTAHAPQRQTEALLTGVIERDAAVFMDGRELDELALLPSLRKRLAERLSEWDAYLHWQEGLASHRQFAWRYDAVRADRSGLLRFRLDAQGACPSLKVGAVQMFAAPASDSSRTDSWRPKGRPSGRIDVGRSLRGPLRDDDRSFVLVEVEDDDEQAVARLLGRIPERGWLVSSLGGDMAPLKNQKGGISRLRNDSGFSPRLGHWVFDIRQADLPAMGSPDPLDEIAPLRELNPGQRAAVTKMLMAPDISLLQGPPGTGKTTVIAEVCRQVTLRGGRVLVSSQTNLAVDNALERLPEHPGIRPLRVAQAHRVDNRHQELLSGPVVGRWFRSISAACRERIGELDARFESDRRLERAAEDLGRIASRHTDLRAVHAELSTRLVELERRRAELLAELEAERGIHDRVRTAAEAAQRLADWASGGTGANLLGSWFEGGTLEEGLRSAASAVCDASGHELGLPVPDGADPSASVLLPAMDRLRSAVEAGAGAAAAVERALALCRSDAPPERSEAEESRALHEERRRLITATTAAELDRLREVNLRLAQLDEDEWTRATLDLRRFCDVARHSALSDRLDDVVAALRPAPAHIGRLESVGAWIRELRGPVRDALATALADLSGLADAEAHQRRGELAEHDDRITELRQQADGLSATAGQVLSRREGVETEVAELESDWRQAWGTTTTATNDEIGSPEVPDSQAATARAARVSSALEADRDERGRARRWRSIQTDWVERLGRAREIDTDELADLYDEHANVVGATCNECGRRQFHEREGFQAFDLVIIDEVSKATPPELIMPLLLGDRAALVGDSNQLEPMFKEREQTYADAVEEGLIDPDDFERYERMVTASLFQELFERADDAIRHSLTTQYRMHPQVMEAVNLFYRRTGELRAGPDEASLAQLRSHGLTVADAQGGLLVEPGQHLLWIDSSRDGRGRRAFELQDKTSKANAVEIDLVAAALERLATAHAKLGYIGQIEESAGPDIVGLTADAWVRRRLGGSPEGTVADLFRRGALTTEGRPIARQDALVGGQELRLDARKPVGVITFYGAQLRRLRDRIGGLRNVGRLRSLDVACNTVDRFQGGERPIVLVSFVRAPEHGAPGQFVRKFQRINVAMSRAQELLMVFGSTEAFKRARVDLPSRHGQPHKSRVYSQILQIAGRHGGKRYAAQLLG